MSAPTLSRPHPHGLTKWFLDMPVRLYRWGLGPLFGARLVVLVHRGRTTGMTRRTALEVLGHRRIDGAYHVASGWGANSDWLRNVRAAGEAELCVGRDRVPVTVQVLPPDRGAAVLRRHLLEHPVATRRVNGDLWGPLLEGEAAFAEAAASLPVVAFTPVDRLGDAGSGAPRHLVRDLLYGLKRWMYRGDRPGLLARVANRRQADRYATGGTAEPGVVLEVVGRTSGRPVRFPLVLAQVDGGEYLVSMLGEGANWVANVRAAEGAAILTRNGHSEPVTLVEVDVAERPPVLRRYLDVAPGARPHVRVDRDASDEAFAAVAEMYPVFRVARPGP